MDIFHCLFWIKNNMVASLLYQSDRFHIMKIGGRKAVSLTDLFWSEWMEYAGMCEGDKTDFCIIYDDKLVMSDILMKEQCDSKYCIWNRSKIESAVKLLEIKEPTEIRNENGTLLLKTGHFMNVKKEDITLMKAWYIKSDKEAELQETSPHKQTTLIKYYKNELQLYKKGYEKNE